MTACRACGGAAGRIVLDLGTVPAADHFPHRDDPVDAGEVGHRLAMWLCGACGLAQLPGDDTVADEPRGIEPRALREQAAEAVVAVAGHGWLRGTSVREFGSPHGGTWLPLLEQHGYRVARDDSPADVVLDSFGMMHEPDQHAAMRTRAAATAPDGVLLLQFHSIAAIVARGQWNALRHGHFAYYSLTALERLVRNTGMRIATAWEFDLYGGTVLVAATRDPTTEPDAAVRAILAREADTAVTSAEVVGALQTAADRNAAALRQWLISRRAAGRTTYAYGAASRAVALFYLAGLDRSLLAGVADASAAKHGRRMPGTGIGIIAPDALVAARPDRVLVTVPDLLPEVREHYPDLADAWIVEAEITADEIAGGN
ncbi:MAG TPA: methyltransferase domain-containing protein [Aldersonia sp.]